MVKVRVLEYKVPEDSEDDRNNLKIEFQVDFQFFRILVFERVAYDSRLFHSKLPLF